MDEKLGIVRKIMNCAEKYNNNLLNKNVMFIFEDRSAPLLESVKCIETTYNATNFYHLTGVKSNLSPLDFFNRAVEQRLSINNIKRINSLTNLKLDVLYNLVQIDKSAKAIGNYDPTTKINLYTEKVVGNVHYCLGFIKDQDSDFYIPNTALKENIKNITYNDYNIMVIMKKGINDDLYKDVTYLKNNANLNALIRNDEVGEKINIENIEFQNKDNIVNTELVDNFREEIKNIISGKYNDEENNNLSSNEDEDEDER